MQYIPITSWRERYKSLFLENRFGKNHFRTERRAAYRLHKKEKLRRSAEVKSCERNYHTEERPMLQLLREVLRSQTKIDISRNPRSVDTYEAAEYVKITIRSARTVKISSRSCTRERSGVACRSDSERAEGSPITPQFQLVARFVVRLQIHL